jgi:DNA-binding HxlR family transcriptional regulator
MSDPEERSDPEDGDDRGGVEDERDHSGVGDWRRTWHAVRDLLGSKWAFHVVRALGDSGRGFNDLKRELDGVTAKTLSERLRELRCLGFVEKEVHATSPPTTTYRLTDHGRDLAAVMTDVESLVEVVECRDGDCAVASAVTPECACETGREREREVAVERESASGRGAESERRARCECACER